MKVLLLIIAMHCCGPNHFVDKYPPIVLSAPTEKLFVFNEKSCLCLLVENQYTKTGFSQRIISAEAPIAIKVINLRKNKIPP